MTNRALRGIFEGRAGFLNSGTAFPFRSVRVEARAGGEGAARVVVESVDLSEYARLRVRGGDGADRLRSSSSSSGVRAGGGEREGDGEARAFPLPLRSDELEEEGLGREAGVEVAMVVLRVLRSPRQASSSAFRAKEVKQFLQTGRLTSWRAVRRLGLCLCSVWRSRRSKTMTVRRRSRGRSWSSCGLRWRCCLRRWRSG